MANNINLSTIQNVLQYLDEGQLLEGTWKDVSDFVKQTKQDIQIKETIKYLDTIIKPDASFDSVCEMFGSAFKQPQEDQLNEKSIINMELDPLDYVNEYAAQEMFDAIKEELQDTYPNTEIENFTYEFTTPPIIKIYNIESHKKEEDEEFDSVKSR